MSLRKYAEFQVISKVLVPRDLSGRSLRRFAHRHHFEYEPRPGYLYVRSRMISSRCNDNFDEFPAEEIKKAWASFIGKPVFVNHHNDDHRRARGVIIDAALHEDKNPDDTPDTWVEGLMEVDAVRFPKLAQAILAGHVDRTSMGTDVEFSICAVCNNKASSPAEYCDHIPKMKGKRIYRRTASGAQEGVLVRERCFGLRFFENSLLVEEPADPTAYFLGVDDRGMKMTAAKLPETQTCKYCGEQATQRLLWAEGMAYIPACDVHEKNARHDIEVTNKDEVVGVRPIKAVGKGRPTPKRRDAQQRRGELERQASLRAVAAESGEPTPLKSSMSSLYGYAEGLAEADLRALGNLTPTESGDTWMAPKGKGPTAEHIEDVRSKGHDVDSAIATAPNHGPYHVVRHPETRETHVVDSKGRQATPWSYGNPEENQAQEGEAFKDWAHLSGHPAGDTADTMKLHRRQNAPLPEGASKIDPKDIERSQRPVARGHEPSGHSPDEEFHGPYEVVQHPETGRYHVVDNAGRLSSHYKGFETQMQAERSRDYIDKRRQSKEKARGIADSLWGNMMDVFDPGGTEESRQSEHNMRTMNDLLGHGYQPHEIKHDEDDRPYGEVKHPSGFIARDHGGANVDIYHAATGDEAHDMLDVGDWTSKGHHREVGFGPVELGKRLHEWASEKDGTREYQEKYHPVIREWKKRNPRGANLLGFFAAAERKTAVYGPFGGLEWGKNNPHGHNGDDGNHPDLCQSCEMRYPHQSGKVCPTCEDEIIGTEPGTYHKLHEQHMQSKPFMERTRPWSEEPNHQSIEHLVKAPEKDYTPHPMTEHFKQLDTAPYDAVTDRMPSAKPQEYFRQSLNSKTAYGETKAPADVDTLRDEECPVCGERDSYDGNACQVCGFDAPPKMFQDPDLDKAKALDLHKDVAEEAGSMPGLEDNAGLPGQVPGSGVPGSDQVPVDPAMVDANGLPQTDPDAPVDPAQVDENGNLVPQVDPGAPNRHFNQGGEPFTPGPNAPGEPGEPEGPSNPEADEPIDPAEIPAPGTPQDGVADLMCPACGFSSDASQPTSIDMDDPTAIPAEGDGMLAGDVCPNCQSATMLSVGEMEQMQAPAMGAAPVQR